MKPLKRVALIDDCYHFYKYLNKKMTLEFGRNIEVSYFSDSDSFVDFLEDKNSNFFDLILADRFIKSYDLFDDDFVETCKKLGFSNKIVLISTDPPANQDQKSEKGRFDAMIRKSTTDMMNELRKILSNI